MDAPPPPGHTSHSPKEIIVDVTTDAQGDVVEVHFQRSSGLDGVDGYVAQSIHESWPRQPSTKSVASLIYENGGFSHPKILSSTPAVGGSVQGLPPQQ